MGKSLESVRMGTKGVSAHWTRAGRVMKIGYHALMLSEMAKRHSARRFTLWTIPWVQPSLDDCGDHEGDGGVDEQEHG